jgi:hypothetical protein
MPKREPTTNTSGQPAPVGPMSPQPAADTAQPAGSNVAASTTQPASTITANAPLSLGAPTESAQIDTSVTPSGR